MGYCEILRSHKKLTLVCENGFDLQILLSRDKSKKEKKEIILLPREKR